MKTFISYFRWLAVIALALGLDACGGYTTVNLGGTVTGLTTNGLILANGNDTVAIAANATSYTFPNQIGDHDPFSITIQAQPQRLTCSIVNGTGTATGIAIDAANVTCVINTYAVGGTITGLTGSDLVLVNGSDTVTPLATDTSFTFPTAVADGTAYGVAVLTQPSNGQTCSVVNGTSIMGAAPVTNVQIVCR